MAASLCVISASPTAPRLYNQVDLSLFGSVPEYVQPSPWTDSEAIEFLPNGVAGVDGIRADQIDALHSDSTRNLAAADAGRIPFCWREARV